MGECNKTPPALKGQMGIKRQFERRPLLHGLAIIRICFRPRLVLRSSATWSGSGSGDLRMLCLERFTKRHHPEDQSATGFTHRDRGRYCASFLVNSFLCARPSRWQKMHVSPGSTTKRLIVHTTVSSLGDGTAWRSLDPEFRFLVNVYHECGG